MMSVSDDTARPEFAAVIAFWFSELRPAQWWRPDPVLDAQIAQRFGTLHGQAVRCELHCWREHPLGRLAEIIVLDQFSRNLHRGTAQAFAADPLALGLAQEAVSLGVPPQLEPQQRAFLYLPYMHSESPHIHAIALQLFSEPGWQQI